MVAVVPSNLVRLTENFSLLRTRRVTKDAESNRLLQQQQLVGVAAIMVLAWIP